MKRLAILMSSCDSYQDLWDPFWKCIEKFSDSPSPYTMYLNTEHAKYKYGGNIQVQVINQIPNREIPWSRRMIDAVKRIPEPYVFLLLDDFFACDTIKWTVFEALLDKMDQERDVASIQLSGTRIRNSNPEVYSSSDSIEYRVMGKKGWKTHFVPTIWRKEILIKWLRPWESIWAFEACGSARARRWKYKEKVLVVESPPVYDYLWIKDCSTVINGKWLGEPEVHDFFEENSIEVDYTQRGTMTHEEYLAIAMKDVLKRYTLPQIIAKSINRVRSFV